MNRNIIVLAVILMAASFALTGCEESRGKVYYTSPEEARAAARLAIVRSTERMIPERRSSERELYTSWYPGNSSGRSSEPTSDKGKDDASRNDRRYEDADYYWQGCVTVTPVQRNGRTQASVTVSISKRNIDSGKNTREYATYDPDEWAKRFERELDALLPIGKDKPR